MVSGTAITEEVSQVEARRLWNAMVKDSHNLFPKVLPELVASVTLIQGDGGVGSIKQINFTTAHKDFSFDKERVDEIYEECRNIAFECPENAEIKQRNAIVAPVEEEAPVSTVTEEVNTPLVLNILRRSGEEMAKPLQRKSLFITECRVGGKCCKMIIDSGSTDNLVSTEVVKKLGLSTINHREPYQVSWVQNEHQVTISKECEVEFQVDKYRDKIVCDVMPMDMCDILLGRPWQYDRETMHNGRKNTYTFKKNGVDHTLFPSEFKNDGVNHILFPFQPGQKTDPETLLFGEKKYLRTEKFRTAELKEEVSIAEAEIQEITVKSKRLTLTPASHRHH